MKIEKLKNNIWVPSTDAQIEIWRENGYPHMQEKCLNQFITWCRSQNKKFKTVIDIGAWCGTWSLSVEQFAKKIYCFEPHTVHYECLYRNTSMNEKIVSYNQAIGNNDDYISLSVEDATQNTRVLKEKGKIKISTLDSFKFKDVDLIKIDVEGLEMEVIKGGLETISNTQYLMIELNNNSKKYGSNNNEIETFLQKELGFRELIKTWPDIVYFK